MRTFCVAATVVATIAMASEAMGEEAARQPPPRERVRLDLGIGLTNVGGTGGGLGAFFPTATVGVEGHLGGPAWLFATGSGYYGETDGSFGEGKGGYVDGAVGLRLEAPVFHWLEMGGYGVVRGAYWEATSSGWEEGRDRSGSLGGALGASAHLRPTRFFGVRLGLEVLRVDYQEWGSEQRFQDADGRSSTLSDGGDSVSVGLVPTPSVALTFTF